MLFYRVNSLPDQILLGKQTETGVQEIGFDCTAWLSRWPDLAIGVLVTAPGGAGSYPADTHMEGNTCIWTVNGSDTAVPGIGSVEVVGLADGKRKLSMTCDTRIISTKTNIPADPPDYVKPWVDRIMATADKMDEAVETAQNTAKRVETAVTDLEDGALNWTNLVNRPFGSDIETGFFLYNGGAVFDGASNFNDAAYCTIKVPFLGVPVDGARYKVTITPSGGSSYNPVNNLELRRYSFTHQDATREREYFFIGNAAIALGGYAEDTGENFVIIIDPDNKPNENGAYGWIYTTSSVFKKGLSRFELSGLREVITHVPDKYMPEVAGVKNWRELGGRPFYSEEGDYFIFPETTVELSDSKAQLTTAPTAQMDANSMYTVVYNGTEYSCKARVYRGGDGELRYSLGNVALAGAGAEDTGEPFYIDVADILYYTPQDGVYARLVDRDGNASATFSVYGPGEKVVKKLDPKYLPDDIPTSGGGVSSWNDLTDKPFCEENTEGYILPEITVYVDADEGTAIIMDEPAAPLVEGETYQVVWNGTEYNCVAQFVDMGGMVGYGLGNIGAVMGGEPSDEPFFILLFTSNEMGLWGMALPMDGSMEATFSVHGAIRTIKTLDEKFLPASIQPPYLARVERQDDDTLVLSEGITYTNIYDAAVAGRVVYLVEYCEGEGDRILGNLTSIRRFSGAHFLDTQVIGSSVYITAYDILSDGIVTQSSTRSV